MIALRNTLLVLGAVQILIYITHVFRLYHLASKVNLKKLRSAHIDWVNVRLVCVSLFFL